jgi:hypothetical protein
MNRMNLLQTEAERLLGLDPLDRAEKQAARLAERGMKVDSMHLAIMFVQQISADREAVLSVLGDTHFNIKYKDMLVIIERAGFERVYTEQFGEYNDVFEVWWHADGLLLTTESYMNDRVNSSQLHYNWLPNPSESGTVWPAPRTSGGFHSVKTDGIERLVFSGYYDGREGLILHIDTVRSRGSFLPVWQVQPHLWFLNYAESKASHEELYRNKDRIQSGKMSRFPEHVQRAIQPTILA